MSSASARVLPDERHNNGDKVYWLLPQRRSPAEEAEHRLILKQYWDGRYRTRRLLAYMEREMRGRVERDE